MPRGGKRLGSGSKPKWKHGKTKVIRVPEVLADRILDIARDLDNGVSFISENEVKDIFASYGSKPCKVVDLTGVSLASISGQMGVKLVDLVSCGYAFKPKQLDDIVRNTFNSARKK